MMLDPETPTSKTVPAVRRAVAILWLLAERGVPMTLSQVARRLEILPSTALHILRELCSARLVAVDPAQKLYRLGTGLIELGQAVVRQNDFAEVAKPYLQEIAARFNVTATATAMIDDSHTACVASVSPPGAMSLNVTVGGRVPTYSGAAGRCFAAFNGPSVSTLRQYFALIRWQGAFEFDAWHDQVRKARVLGYAEDDGRFARGVTTIAVPIFAPDGSVTQTIGVASISAALDPDIRTAVATTLVDVARQICGRRNV